ncbi:MAG TPA: RpiB/LacA/LacB family sugar-phosphate isomerase, partial [Thermoanaerobaculia bacterium]|nr:RpiB/LacA/LacB family sugar-phosphate isomerase [Thermoanaerobaculia bacterium]
LGARVIGSSLAADLIRIFLAARFSGAERHVRRVAKIKAIEEDSRRGAFDRPASIAIEPSASSPGGRG